MSECEREDTRWKKEMVSDILLISTSLLQWTRWDEMPLRWKSALHRYADVKNMPLWLFGRNSRMSTYGSLTQESCCCKKKPFSHPGTFQGYQIKCCHIYTCLEGAGLFCKKAGWRQQQLKMFREEGGGTGDPLTDGKSSVICFSSCVLPVETLVSVRNSEPLSCPCQAFLAPPWRWVSAASPEWCRAHGMHNQPPINMRHWTLFLTCTANMGWSYYLWGLAFGDGIYTGISIELISVPAPRPTCTAEHVHFYLPCRVIFKLRFSRCNLRAVGSVT